LEEIVSTLQIKQHKAIHQHGAALITSLVILLVLTVLGISAMQSSTLQENIVGNLRDHDLAVQAAESGLSAAENALYAVAQSSAAPPRPLTPPATNQPNNVFPINYFYNNVSELDKSAQLTSTVWASPNATPVGTALPSVYAAAPMYLIEFEQFTCDNLDPESCAKGLGTYNYRITARGVGLSTNSAVLLQETYAIHP
jgi:type IV pilus assembly protein PilX